MKSPPVKGLPSLLSAGIGRDRWQRASGALTGEGREDARGCPLSKADGRVRVRRRNQPDACLTGLPAACRHVDDITHLGRGIGYAMLDA